MTFNYYKFISFGFLSFSILFTHTHTHTHTHKYIYIYIYIFIYVRVCVCVCVCVCGKSKHQRLWKPKIREVGIANIIVRKAAAFDISSENIRSSLVPKFRLIWPHPNSIFFYFFSVPSVFKYVLFYLFLIARRNLWITKVIRHSLNLFVILLIYLDSNEGYTTMCQVW